MAKVGEGDPRWIVTERKDGANVNAWHWEERDLSRYTHEQLEQAFKGLPIVKESDGLAYLMIDEASEVAGDVTVAQRKGKMMCYFELKLKLRWSGKLADDAAVDGGAEEAGTSEVKGAMEIPEVDHDSFRDRYEITVTCQDNNAVARKIEEVVRSKGRAKVRAQIEAYFDKLFAEYHIGQVLRSGTVMPPPPQLAGVEAKASTTSAVHNDDAAAQNSTTKSSSSSSFTWRMRWRAPIEKLFECLTDERSASVYTRSPAKVDARTGGQFDFLNGLITGYFVEVQAPVLIKEQWRLGSWPAGVHSSVVMQLTKEEPDVTILDFAQSGIPAGQVDGVQEGWRAHFFNALKIFGYSVEFI